MRQMELDTVDHNRIHSDVLDRRKRDIPTSASRAQATRGFVTHPMVARASARQLIRPMHSKVGTQVATRLGQLAPLPRFLDAYCFNLRACRRPCAFVRIRRSNP